MNTERDKLWSAYLDGEMSVTEASEFDDSLSDDERKQLAGEMRFETSLGEVLAKDASCPDTVWKRVKKKVRRAHPVGVPGRLGRWLWTVSAVAAGLVIAVAFLLPRHHSGLPPFLTLAAADIPALQLQSVVPTGNPEALMGLLRRTGVDLRLKPLQSTAQDTKHERVLLGGKDATYKGEALAEVFFGCCGEPVKVVLARQDGMAAHAIQDAIPSGQLQATGRVGDYLVTVIGQHPAPGLINLFEGNEA